MPNDKHGIFISYARNDGETFAKDLRQKLIAEFGENTIWRDRDRMEGGVNWWKQITDALDNVAFMVLVATPSAMTSPVVRKEWRYARQQGVCVYPVQVPELPIDFNSLPRWMRDSHFYNLDAEWQTFIGHLHSACDAVRVPFYGVPDLPEHFVERPEVFEQMKAQLLDEARDNPVAITTSLVGAGGFGKTTLAAALCHDDDVQTAFDDGVLWVTLGENPNLLLIFNGLYRTLTDENRSFETVHEAASRFSEKLAENDILLVVDDIWESEHAKRFLQGGERCARLLTTRFSNIVNDANAKPNNVDEMTTTQSVQLLLSGIDPQPTDLSPFETLAERLGEWALMLDVTNGTLRKRISKGADLADALAYINKALDKRGVGGLKTGSNEVAIRVLDTSIEQLEREQQSRLFELAIFLDDSDIPLTSVMALWDWDDFDTEELVDLLDDLSFVKFDAETQTIRLHDVVREVLASKLQTEQAPTTVHARLIRNYGIPVGTGHALSETMEEGFSVALPDDYAWINLAYHLIQAEQHDTLRDLLLTFDYLQNKLDATDPNALIADCDSYLKSADDRLIELLKSAFILSSHITQNEPSRLLECLSKHLAGYDRQFGKLAELFENAEVAELIPTHPNFLSFKAAGGTLIRTLAGHINFVNCVAVSGIHAISASSDDTLKVWNWQTGELLRTLEGHTNSVNSVVLSGVYAVSGSGTRSRLVSQFVPQDYTLKVWNWQTGELLRTLEGHTNSVNSVALSGVHAVSASGFDTDPFSDFVSKDDYVLRVWNWQTGELILTLDGHTDAVNGVALSEEYAVSASSDSTLKVWNWQTGELLRTLEGHTNAVNSVALSGIYAVSTSYDETLRVWNWQTGELLRTLEGHTNAVNGVALSGTYAISASGSGSHFRSQDYTLKVWNWQTGELLRTLEGHTNAVNSVDLSGAYAVSTSSDKTLKVWNWQLDEVSQIIEGHVASVDSIVISGKYAISGGGGSRFTSQDNTLKVWNWQTGELLRTLESTNTVNSVALSGIYVIGGSRSKDVLKVWNWQTGELLRTSESFTSSVNDIAVSGTYAVNASGSTFRSQDNVLNVWNWQTDELLRTLEGHTASVNCVAISGTYVISGGGGSLFDSEDYTLKVWNWQTGELLKTLEGHTASVNCVAISGTYAVSGSGINSGFSAQGNTLKVWNWQTGDCLYTFYADTSLYSVAITPNFERIIAGDAQGHVHFLRPNVALLKLLRGQ
ncbi:MAG: NB-ARC domain-containing protein [Chloroflexota bacterium]